MLQIRRPQYWRIELPLVDAEDARRAERLREVLAKVLQFERTECPFGRTFTVELPEIPQTPVRKRPWTPVRKPVVVLPPTPVTPVEFKKGARRNTAKDWHRVDAEDGLAIEGAVRPRTEEFEQEDEGEKTGTAANLESPGIEQPALPIMQRPGFQSNRSFTAPPQLSILTASPSRTQRALVDRTASDQIESQSPTESQDSFHSIQSWHSPLTPLPPSPPVSSPRTPMTSAYPHGTIIYPGDPLGLLESDHTTTTNTPRTRTSSPAVDLASAFPQSPRTYGEVDRSANASVTSEKEQGQSNEGSADSSDSSPAPVANSTATKALKCPRIRQHATTSSSVSSGRRGLSPLPPAANLFTPHHPYKSSAVAAQSKMTVARQIPMAVLSKTCEILLSPPSHLINIMLKVAARITNGEWWLTGESAHVQWDWSGSETGSEAGADYDISHDGLGGWAEDHAKSCTTLLQVKKNDHGHPRQQKMAGSFPSDDEFGGHEDLGWGVD